MKCDHTVWREGIKRYSCLPSRLMIEVLAYHQHDDKFHNKYLVIIIRLNHLFFSKQSYKYLLFIHSFMIPVNRLWCSPGWRYKEISLMGCVAINQCFTGTWRLHRHGIARILEENRSSFRFALHPLSLHRSPQMYLPTWQGITRC